MASWDAIVLTSQDTREVHHDDHGFSASLYAIYDWRFSRNFALSPYLAFEGLGFTFW